MPYAFLASSLLAFIGGHILNYSLILYMQERVGSPALAGLAFALCFGSSLVYGWFTGVWADRAPPLRLVHLAHGLFVLCLAGLGWVEFAVAADARGTVVLLCASVGGVAWSIFGPARMASLGRLAHAAQLKPATILFNLTVMIGFGLAPWLIGLLRPQAGWSAVFALAAGAYIASSLLLLGQRPAPAPASSDGPWAAQIAESLRAVIRDPLMRQLMLAAMIGFAVTGPFQLLLPRLAESQLGLIDPARGAFVGAFAFALILGGLLALPLSRRLPHGPSILLGIVAVGLLFALLAACQQVGTALLLLFALGSCAGLAISLIVANLQNAAPPAQRGRIMGFYSMISQILPASSGLLAGLALQGFGLRSAVIGAGLLLALCGLAAAARFATLRALRG